MGGVFTDRKKVQQAKVESTPNGNSVHRNYTDSLTLTRPEHDSKKWKMPYIPPVFCLVFRIIYFLFPASASIFFWHGYPYPYMKIARLAIISFFSLHRSHWNINILTKKAVEATKQKEERRIKTKARGTGRHAIASALPSCKASQRYVVHISMIQIFVEPFHSRPGKYPTSPNIRHNTECIYF
jgi:hypothetical protein